MKLSPPANINYAATIFSIKTILEFDLKTLVGVPVLGHQALTQRGYKPGDLVIAFTAETQLTPEYAGENDLFRHATMNKTDATGYLEDSGRIKAIQLAGHRSNALLMPLSSVAYTGVDISEFKEGDTFDALNGHKICQKYLVTHKGSLGGGGKSTQVSRVDGKLFPKHFDTANYHRSKFLLNQADAAVVTQKLHGTSWRGGRVSTERELNWKDRLALRLGVQVATHYPEVFFGSRNQVMDVNHPAGYFGTDIWSEYGRRIQDLIPENYMIYGELIGWTPAGAPIQKGYTYDLPHGHAELYVYRVQTVNPQGVAADLPWDAVRRFCDERGLKHVPELFRIPATEVDGYLAAAEDAAFYDDWSQSFADVYVDIPLPLSDPNSVDEGVVIRQEGLEPVILKAKSQAFLEYESKQLDTAEADIESAA